MHRARLGAAVSRGFEAMERTNDHSTHTQVLAAFDRAIAAATSSLLLALLAGGPASRPSCAGAKSAAQVRDCA